MSLYLPHNFKTRPYQMDLMKAMMKDNKRFALIVWHRRAGKDLTCLNIIIAKAFERVGTYYYLFPEIAHARRVIWDGITKEGKKFLDYIPRALIIGKPNNLQMKIKLINGSVIQFGGINDYNRVMGTNPIGIILSEYSIQNPLGWQYLSPILTENKGWLIFNYTPRGRNHGFKMLQHAQNSPDFFSQVLTIKETGVVTEEEIQMLRDQGIDEETIQQEFYCSFDSAVRGAFYADNIKLAQAQGRIRTFEINPMAPTYTFWDLGVRDPMAIWVMQKIGDELRMCFYYENSGGGMKNAIEWIFHIKEKYQLLYVEHYAPHDIENRSLASGRTRMDECRDFGINFITVRRAKNIIEDINSTRGIFHRIHFHAQNCDQGLAALQEYHAHFDEKTQFVGAPVHNWASNGADALRTFGIAWTECVEKNHTYSGTMIRPTWSV